MDSLLNWFSGLFHYFSGGLLTLARRVESALGTLWTTVTGAFSRWLVWGGLIRQAAANLFVNMLYTVWAIYDYLIWLAFTWVPFYAGYVFGQATQYAYQIVSFVYNQLAAALYLLAQEVGAALSQIVSWTYQQFVVFLGDLTALRDRLYQAEKLVYGLLTDPSKLAGWLVGAMAQALLRYLDANAEAFAEWLWPRLLPVIIRQLPRLEALISRIF